MRLRKKKCTPKRLLELKDYFIEVNPDEIIDVKKVFDNGNEKTHIEIGAGKGKFINELARRNPEINYIAFEKNSDIIAIAALKGYEDAAYLPNLKFANADAEMIDKIFSPDTIERIYLNFSDPWPKSRQKKRRLTHRIFLEKYNKIMTSDGEIHFKTDNKKLYEFSVLEMAEMKFQILEATLDLHNSEYVEGNIMTEYEERFSAMGTKINKIAVKINK